MNASQTHFRCGTVKNIDANSFHSYTVWKPRNKDTTKKIKPSKKLWTKNKNFLVSSEYSNIFEKRRNELGKTLTGYFVVNCLQKFVSLTS